MTDQPGHLWAVIQEWLDAFRFRPPSQRELAPKLRVSASTFGDYKYARAMPSPAFLILLAEEIGVPYERLLDAALEDQGYRGELLRYIREEVMGNAEHPAPIGKSARTHQRKTARMTAGQRAAEAERLGRSKVAEPLKKRAPAKNDESSEPSA